MNELDFVMELLIQDLEEALGEKGVAILHDMHKDHRSLDKSRLYGGYAKPSKAVHMAMGMDRLVSNMQGQRDRNREIRERLAETIGKNPSAAVTAYKRKTFATKYPISTDRMGKENYNKPITKIAKKSGVLHINDRGIENNKPFRLGDTGVEDGPYAFPQYHHENNQKRLKAVRRLWDYIDKKGYDDESYEAKHKENMERAKAARKKNRMRAEKDKWI